MWIDYRFSLSSTGSGSTWATAADTLTLRTGLNTITYQQDSGDNAANSIDLPYSIPDSASGSEYDPTIGLYVNGSRARSIILITTAGTFGIEIKSTGSGSFTGVTVSGAADGGLSASGGENRSPTKPVQLVLSHFSQFSAEFQEINSS